MMNDAAARVRLGEVKSRAPKTARPAAVRNSRRDHQHNTERLQSSRLDSASKSDILLWCGRSVPPVRTLPPPPGPPSSLGPGATPSGYPAATEDEPAGSRHN